MRTHGGRGIVLAVAVALSGCASASVYDAHGELLYRAFALGQGHAAAGRCDRVWSDASVSTNGTEQRTTKDDERGTLCATASGGRGSPGLWATVAAGFAALGMLLAGAL